MSLLYQKVLFADSPLDLTVSDLDDSNFNQNSLVMDFDTSAGIVIVNLPSINSMLFATTSAGQGTGGGALSFYIKGTIIAGANAVTLTPAQGDDICGNPTGQSITGAGGCFHLFVSGLNRWGLLVCGFQSQQIPPIGN